jgi:ribosomal protein S18 acetylase RimI-like enzyme
VLYVQAAMLSGKCASYFLMEVDSVSKAESLRVMRNECRKYMTRHTDLITAEQQSAWFLSLDRTRLVPFLFVESWHGACFLPVGYGVVRRENGYSVLSGGLTEDYRGNGLGKALFKCLIAKSDELLDLPIALEVLLSNVRAQSLYTSLGFVITYMNESVIKMSLKQ